MPYLTKPSAETVRAFLEAQAALPFTYGAIGATAGIATGTLPPPGFVLDHTRVRLGAGGMTFAAARAALGRWEQFRLGWVCPWPPEGITVGAAVAVAARAGGVWWLNACRIVYTIDEADGGADSVPRPVARFGFAYGTLPGHAESGEERFAVEWDRADDAVYYDVLAFSRPRQVMARLARHWARRLQKKFARDSAAAMAAAAACGRP